MGVENALWLDALIGIQDKLKHRLRLKRTIVKVFHVIAGTLDVEQFGRIATIRAPVICGRSHDGVVNDIHRKEEVVSVPREIEGCLKIIGAGTFGG